MEGLKLLLLIGDPVLWVAPVGRSLDWCFPINFLLNRVLEGSASQNVSQLISLVSPLPLSLLSSLIFMAHLTALLFPSCPPSRPLLFTEQPN